MFTIPKPMKCPKCGTTGYFDSARPCKKCLDEFIRQHVPVMVHDPDGKPYDPKSQATLD